ncbi:MAG: VIT1/CCC1 transporter family protein [Bacteroidales bacterium]|nr:VIT1/CCC1 transporter family protein [Bacteroidales bacterium]MBN2820326.1 VIT1/CCC1 transporter family protein [Bacteroidales bacterium]
MNKNDKRQIAIFQQQEINGYYIYKYLANKDKNEDNKAVLNKIASDEKHHYEVYKRYTGIDTKPQKFRIFLYKLAASILGPTFAIKLLEKNEVEAQNAYATINNVPEIKKIIADEEEHEIKLIEMLEEERLNYMGSIVLGLNDALVELTGALAGLTLALRDPELIALTGSITGVAAAFSMAASEYLSTKSEGSEKGALKASLYTGVAYIFTVIVLILPFLLLTNVFLSLGLTVLGAVLIIAAFNYYYSVVKDEKFSRRFTEMVLLSFGVALFSFGIGFVLRKSFGVEV